MSNIVDSACSPCDQFNGTFILKYRGVIEGVCTWDTDEVSETSGPPCNVPGAPLWTLTCASNSWILHFGSTQGSTGPFWRKEVDWDCCGENVMDVVDSGNDCSGWPSTITVSPVGDCPPCPVQTGCCEQEIPPTLTANFSGVINGDVVLTHSGGIWSGTFVNGACTFPVTLSCEGGEWVIAYGDCGNSTANNPPNSFTCDPLQINYQEGPCPCLNLPDCCDPNSGETVTITIT